ncbi:PREDICTED: uncharacterized protein LOC109461536, partial [Branchiostoma belcheri]|uniref:Uncharacterized protein LOC109461536 n=1 Tax=Branchiostoma belcheri TaxID=7741 RepID=A0A6P4Y9M6_BRABE
MRFQDDMGRKLRHLLIFLLLVLKEPNTPEDFNDMMASIPNLQIRHNPWQCDCPVYTPTVIGAMISFAGGVILTLWCKRRFGNSDSGSNSNPALHTTNTTAVVVTSGLDHQYEDVDQHNQTGQGQSQTIAKSNTNTTATVVASGHDHRYEDMNHHVTTRQGQSQAITKSNTNATAVVATSGHDHKHEYMNLHNQTGQGQGQSQTNTETLDARNLSYGTGPIVSQLNSLYKTTTTGQGQSQAITESNTNTTATVMTSGGDQAGQGQ